MIDLATVALPPCRGTRSTFVGGCSCERCRGANAEYMREYRKRKSERTVTA